MLNPNRFKHHIPQQGELLPTYIGDLVPEDHLARVINDVVESLDLTALYSKYGWEGGASFHPKSLLNILFYGYSQGERSSRRLSRQCYENFVYIYLSGSIKPDFRTISEFRRKNFELLKNLFKQIVLLCYGLGMVAIGKISLDGTKVKANAGDRHIVERDKLKQELEKIEQQITQILAEAEATDTQEDAELGVQNSGDELPPQLQQATDRRQQLKALLVAMDRQGLNKMSLTDNDSRFMKSHGRIQLSYNAQCATENQVILAYDLNNQEDDSDQLITMVAELEDIATQVTDNIEFPLADVELGTDAGYDSGKNLQHLEARKIDGYVVNQKARLKVNEQQGRIAPRVFSKDKFSYHADGDYYECPAGQRLEFKNQHITAKKTYHRTGLIYQGQACHHCAFQQQCVTSKTGYRTVTRYAEYDPYREKMDKKLATETGRAIMTRRKTDVEPVFGQIKQTMFRHNPLLMRSQLKAKGEFCLACIAHNIKKIASFLISAKNGNKLVNIRKIQLKLA